MVELFAKWFGERNMPLPVSSVGQCRHETHAGHCDLLEDLRLKQARRELVSAELAVLPGVDSLEIPWLEEFFWRFCASTTERRSFSRLAQDMADRELDGIISDIQTIKAHNARRAELTGTLSQLDAQIADIKSKLGIR